MLEKTLESSLDSKEIKPVNPKENQSRIFMGRTDAEAEAPILWPPDAKNWLIGKAPDTGEDWRQKEKGMTKDEMVGWYHHLSGHEFEQIPGDSEGQGSQACCSPWGCKESDMTEQLNWTELRDVGGSKPDHRYKLKSVFTSEVCGRSVGFKDMYLLDQDRLHQWLSKCDSWVAALTSPGNLLLLLSGFSCVRLLATPWTVAHQAPPYMGFSRQEYWSGVPLPSPGNFLEMQILELFPTDLWIRNSGGGSQQFVFQQTFHAILVQAQVWESLG